jgi:tetratricopeptide (TPR) repeat protein
METYRISSKLKEREHEYLIQTANDASQGLVSTTVYVDGVQTETVNCPHPAEINPQEVLALVKLAHGEKKKEMESLLQTYRQVIADGSPAMMYQLGTAFYYKRLCWEAAELFRAVTGMEPNHHQALNYLGMTLQALGRIEEAVSAATAAVELRPGYADYRNNLGEAYLAANSPEKAIGEFQQAVAINMYYADAYFNLGLGHILRIITNPDPERVSQSAARVIECLNKAALIYPDYKDRSDFGEGLQAVKHADFSRALNLLAGIREAKKANYRREFASFYMRFVLFPGWITEQAVTERIKYLEEEVERNPNYVDLKAELAQCYLEQSRLIWQRGVEQFEKAAEMNSSLPNISSALQEARMALEHLSNALGRVSGKG